MSQIHPYEIPVREPVREAHIEFCWCDGNGETRRTFQNVQELAAFLQFNSILGRSVGYSPKIKK